MSRTLPDINCHRPLSAMNHVKFSTDFDQFNRRPTLQGSYDAFQGREHYADNDQVKKITNINCFYHFRI